MLLDTKSGRLFYALNPHRLLFEGGGGRPRGGAAGKGARPGARCPKVP